MPTVIEHGVEGRPHHDLHHAIHGHAQIVAVIAEHAQEQHAKLEAIREEHRGAELERSPASPGTY